MPEFPLRLQPVTGGYAVHYNPCDHTGVTKAAPALVAASVSDALAQLHHREPNGLRQPVQVFKMSCARNVPTNDAQPMGWQERHDHYCREAATALAEHAKWLSDHTRFKGAQIEASRWHAGRHIPGWEVATADVKESWRYGYQATMTRPIVSGITDPKVQAAEVIRRAEDVYARLMTDAAAVDGHADPVARARHEIHRQAAAELARDLRHHLGKIIAHRTLRDRVE
ncbi:hypothetical protein ACFPC0_11200 [Streptomyces andamanensis]|uniref:Uncharacterized protein n=1 Tax=Streptomyces andamanensis TaxID=1565035 RepID=A0ABV8TCQ5_9ACTN